ncbi:MAG: GTPase [Merdibacter sp.]
MLADVGLVGFPSVGKSTLLSVVSAAGDRRLSLYDDRTNLGVVQVPDGRSFIMADLPGLIEGASQGRAWGTSFCGTSSAAVSSCMSLTWERTTGVIR